MDPFNKNLYTILNFVGGKSENDLELFHFAVILTSEEKKNYYDCIQNLSYALKQLNHNESQFLLNSIHNFKIIESQAENSDNINYNFDIKIVLENMLRSIKQECKDELKFIPQLV